MKLVLVVLLAMGAGCATHPPPTAKMASDLKLELGNPTGPDLVALVSVLNDTDAPVAIGDAFGFDGVYFDIEFAGALIPNQGELFERPRIICLKPHDRFSFDVPLRHLERSFNGRSSRNDWRYPVLPAGQYQARVVYKSPPVALKADCASTVGSVASGWVNFQVQR